MSGFLSQIAAGIIVALILGWLGLGGSKKVVMHNGKSNKHGKWIMIFSAISAIITFSIASNKPFDINNPGLSYSLFMFFIFTFLIGKIIAWFQRN